MPSAFEKFTKHVVQELASGEDMVAVRSLIDSDGYSCLSLVREKKSWFGFQYHTTDLTLKDILEPEEGKMPIDEVDAASPGQMPEFPFLDDVDSKVEVRVKVPKAITVDGIAESSHGTQGQETNLVNKQNVPETTEFSCEQNETSVTIPSGKVLGYRIKQLIFSNSGTMSICFLDRTETFPKESDGGSPGLESRSLSVEDLRDMKEMVQDLRSGLQDLTEKEQTDMLSYLTNFHSNNGHLQDLEERLYEVLISRELQMEDPAFPLISSLFNAAGVLEEGRVEAIQTFLDALMELCEEDQKHVFEALEMNMLPELVDKVESALKEDWGEQYRNPHDMDPDSDARFFFALYVALSILLQLSEKPTSS